MLGNEYQPEEIGDKESMVFKPIPHSGLSYVRTPENALGIFIQIRIEIGKIFIYPIALSG